MDAVVDGLIGFIWEDGTAGADVNFNLEVGKRLDTFAVDGGALEFGGGGAVDDAVFVSPVGAVFVSPFVSPTNEDIGCLLKKTKIDLHLQRSFQVSQRKEGLKSTRGAFVLHVEAERY